ncbi:MAG TPA: hypothetical protein DHT43_02140, partial [Deltaproteobacteria bacterium]|nr:hypothetical protein [Deltaproteobacteria bacterium]
DPSKLAPLKIHKLALMSQTGEFSIRLWRTKMDPQKNLCNSLSGTLLQNINSFAKLNTLIKIKGGLKWIFLTQRNKRY